MKTHAPSLAEELQGHVRFRKVEASDLPALEWEGEYIHFRRLYSEAYQASLEGRVLLWVVELDGVGIVGQLFIQLNSARKELANGFSRAYIYGFRIKPAYRGRGLGTWMMVQVEADLARRGYQWATLNVGRDNPKARRLYERLDYHVAADEPGRWSYIDHLGQRQDVNEPAWRMEKRLAPNRESC
jgi:ribosomal protein S18 acetylase RimI-like enzyme